MNQNNPNKAQNPPEFCTKQVADTQPKKQSPLAVAVAVLRYQEWFLLALRQQYQHQGGKFEFVGGKICHGESAKSALVREIQEEIGLSLKTDQMVFIGRINHDYGDRAVILHIYEAKLNKENYHFLRQQHTGLEGQSLHWFDMPTLIKHKDSLPAANAAILDWLNLPDTLYVSHALHQFVDTDAFVAYYVNRLPKDALVYLRSQSDENTDIDILKKINNTRKDIGWVVRYAVYQQLCDDSSLSELTKGAMVKLTADELEYFANNPEQMRDDVVLLLGVHDEQEAYRANHLAKSRRVLAALVSPVLPTDSHQKSEGLGWERFAMLNELCDVPCIALGGMKIEHLPIAKSHGARAIAGIRGLLS